MSRLAPVVLVVSAAVAAAQPSALPGKYDRLLPYLPPDTNVLVLIDVKAAYDSPVGKSEKWADDYGSRYKSGVGFVPPNTGEVVIGSQVNLTTMTRDHQVGVVGVPVQLPVKALADKDGGTVTEIAGRPFALSPRDVYLTTLSIPATVALYPADRQAAARWSRYAATVGGPAPAAKLSRQLTAAVAKADGKVVTVAVDLTDSQDQTILRHALAASPAVVAAKVAPADVARIARFVSSVKGLTFSAAIGEAITGTVTIEFGEENVIFKPVIHALFLEALDDYGVSLPGVSAWQTTYGPGSMTLTGPMSTADLRRVMSLFAFPGTAAEDAGLKPGEVSGAATGRYFAATQNILTDLRSQKESKDYNKMATWHDKAAAQLDQLSRTGVDPIAVKAAAEASRRLKAISLSLRGAKIDLENLNAGAFTIGAQSGGLGGWWGGRSMYFQSTVPQARAQMAQVVAADEKSRIATWAQIDQIMSDARNQLAEKYKTGF